MRLRLSWTKPLKFVVDAVVKENDEQKTPPEAGPGLAHALDSYFDKIKLLIKSSLLDIETW